jgi:hypothetical protein
MFEKREEYFDKIPSNKSNTENMLISVEELWREFIYVYL